jgi:hypothetical protein
MIRRTRRIKIRVCLSIQLRIGQGLIVANLAHVPCRFFKQGACTAGDSCPFSHSMPERKSARSPMWNELIGSWEKGDLSMVPKGELQVWA